MLQEFQSTVIPVFQEDKRDRASCVKRDPVYCVTCLAGRQKRSACCGSRRPVYCVYWCLAGRLKRSACCLSRRPVYCVYWCLAGRLKRSACCGSSRPVYCVYWCLAGRWSTGEHVGSCGGWGGRGRGSQPWAAAWRGGADGCHARPPEQHPHGPAPGGKWTARGRRGWGGGGRGGRQGGVGLMLWLPSWNERKGTCELSGWMDGWEQGAVCALVIGENWLGD